MSHITNHQEDTIQNSTEIQFTPIRMSVIKKKKQKITSARKDVERECCTLLVGICTSISVMEHTSDVPQKIK